MSKYILTALVSLPKTGRNKVFSWLESNGFTINTLKCAWAIKETNWNSYWFNANQPQALEKCIPTILKQKPPCKLKKMCNLLGALNEYWLTWSKWAYLIKPLFEKSGKKYFVWPHKVIKPSNKWNQQWLHLSSWHTPITIYLTISKLMLPTTIWALVSSNSNNLLHIGPKSWLTPKNTILWRNKSSPL